MLVYIFSRSHNHARHAARYDIATANSGVHTIFISVEEPGWHERIRGRYPDVVVGLDNLSQEERAFVQAIFRVRPASEHIPKGKL